ncbi:hypothetical protein Thimo_2474 [Thioflavicoccus mobilis 8321]|uniref:Uncharacterized protein n=1 Tax=Thioflavicoccus mobilis 8321 TaxID=765912 RepID=L0H0P2_9GAMM|nr:hypothetical protein Thimo_2474 [Thioflavicoccus mobilis 8321]
MRPRSQVSLKLPQKYVGITNGCDAREGGKRLHTTVVVGFVALTLGSGLFRLSAMSRQTRNAAIGAGVGVVWPASGLTDGSVLSTVGGVARTRPTSRMLVATPGRDRHELCQAK